MNNTLKGPHNNESAGYHPPNTSKTPFRAYIKSGMTFKALFTRREGNPGLDRLP